MVLALHLLAALACSVNVSTANIKSARMTKDEQGETKTSVFAPTDTFYCIVELANASDSTKTKAVWKAVAVQSAEPNYVVGEYELTSGSGTLTFNASPPPGGWPVGKYQVELYLNGDKKQTVDFEVQG
jgi:hypothetical protein